MAGWCLEEPCRGEADCPCCPSQNLQSRLEPKGTDKLVQSERDYGGPDASPSVDEAGGQSPLLPEPQGRYGSRGLAAITISVEMPEREVFLPEKARPTRYQISPLG